MQTRKKSARRGLLVSATSLLLSVAMLVGTTFAWFTDSVSSGVNKIQAGNLDIELTHKSASAREEEVTESVKLFKDLNGGDIHWEPGAVTWETFTVSNVGTLALKYQLAMNIVGNNWVVDTAGQTTTRSLKDVIKVYIFDEDKSADFSSREAVVNAVKALNADTLEDFIVNGSMQAGGDRKSYTVVLYWKPQENDQDNLYNLQNGLKASDAAEGQVGQLYINLGIKLNATQYTSENDSFGPDYDADADGVNDYTGHQTVASTKATLNTEGATTLTTNNTPAKVNQTTVTIPQNAIEVNPGEENATLELTAKTTTIELANITDFVVTGSDTSGAVAAIDLTLTKTVDNTVTEVTDFAIEKSVEVVTYITAGLSEGSVNVVYTGNDGKDQPREVQYDPVTGRLSFKTNHFSNYVATTTDNAYNISNETGYPTAQEAINGADDGETITLLRDVTLADKLTVNKSIVLDLNGKTIRGENSTNIYMETGVVTVKNGVIDVSGEAFRVKGTGNTTDNSLVLNLESDVTVKSSNDCCVFIFGCAVLNTKATLCNNSEYTTIQTHGNYDTTIVNVEGGVVTNEGGTAIYFANGKELNISGGELTGTTAVAAKGGKVTISGNAILHANGEWDDPTSPENSGTNDTGDAFYIEDNYTPAVTAKISGGTLISDNAKAVNILFKQEQKGSTISITGGTFSSDPNKYVAEGKCAIQNSEGMYVIADATHVTTEDQLKDALSNTSVGDYVYLADNIILTTPLTISRDVTLVGNGSNTISACPVYVDSNANVTFKNVNFATPGNANQNASSVYASKFVAKVVFDGCTFTNPQWECIQITPMNDAKIVVTDCTFIADGKGTYAQAGGKKVERLLHIENTADTGKYTAVIINNKFVGVDICRNAVIDVDDIAAFANVTCGGNTFAKHDGTAVDTLGDNMIYVNIYHKYDTANVATNTYAQFTQTPAAALHH